MISVNIRILCEEIAKQPGKDSIEKLYDVFPAANKEDNDHILATLIPLVHVQVSQIYRFIALKYNALLIPKQLTPILNQFLLEVIWYLSVMKWHQSEAYIDPMLKNITRYLVEETPLDHIYLALDYCEEMLQLEESNPVFVNTLFNTLRAQRPDVLTMISNTNSPVGAKVKSILFGNVHTTQSAPTNTVSVASNSQLSAQPSNVQRPPINNRSKLTSPYGYTVFPASTRFPVVAACMNNLKPKAPLYTRSEDIKSKSVDVNSAKNVNVVEDAKKENRSPNLSSFTINT